MLAAESIFRAFKAVLCFPAVASSVSDATVPSRKTEERVISTVITEFTMETESDKDTAERLNQSTTGLTRLLWAFKPSFSLIGCFSALRRLGRCLSDVALLVNKQHESSPNWWLSPPVKPRSTNNRTRASTPTSVLFINLKYHQRVAAGEIHYTLAWGISGRSKATISRRDYRSKLLSNF